MVIIFFLLFSLLSIHTSWLFIDDFPRWIFCRRFFRWLFFVPCIIQTIEKAFANAYKCTHAHQMHAEMRQTNVHTCILFFSIPLGIDNFLLLLFRFICHSPFCMQNNNVENCCTIGQVQIKGDNKNINKIKLAATAKWMVKKLKWLLSWEHEKRGIYIYIYMFYEHMPNAALSMKRRGMRTWWTE